MQCSNTMSIATSSASSMDPLCATGLLRLIPSLSPGYSTAPDPHGPGLPRHEPSLKGDYCSVYWVSNKIFYHLFAYLSLFSCCFLSYTKLQIFYFLLSPKKYHALFFFMNIPKKNPFKQDKQLVLCLQRIIVIHIMHNRILYMILIFPRRSYI